MRLAVRRMYVGGTYLEEIANQALDTSDIIEAASVGSYTPENGASYPNNSVGDGLELVAQVTKLNLGLQVATIDYGGWDTHNSQNGSFNGNISAISQALEAFWTDMAAYRDRTTLCVVTEFGRRLRENANSGSDHGHAWAMMVLSGNVNGGQIYGTWPGLETENLDNNVDLAITTDYRAVLAEVIAQRVGDPDFGYVFPGLSVQNGLGLFGPWTPPPPGPQGLTLR
jgi:uncharacterized protein (DUF1501 family)